MGSKNSVLVEHLYNLSTRKAEARKNKEFKASLNYIVNMTLTQVHNILLKKKKLIKRTDSRSGLLNSRRHYTLQVQHKGL